MLDKLKGNGITTWFLMANDEGHGYVKAKNQDFLFYATVRFVRQFLLGENVSTTANDAQSRNSNKQRSRSAFRLADRA
jgi:RNase P protein component